MKQDELRLPFLTGAAAMTLLMTATLAAPPALRWETVVNNNDLIPPLELRTFNSYNPPSINRHGHVVIRARSRGGPPLGPATHGIYRRNMAVVGSPIVRILDRTSLVPAPNNLDTHFVETPSFPRIDRDSDTIASRGNHSPVWNYLVGTDPDSGETSVSRTGTTGIYADPFGDLVTGASKLGDLPEFSFFEVPEFPGARFEVFPGAPAITQGDTIVFKGNYTVGNIGKTGVYYRPLDDDPIPLDAASLTPAAGTSPVVLIANNTHTVIPGTGTVFGATAPPSAAGDHLVFAGFDDEDNPNLGGIYLAPLAPQPELTPLVNIGDRVAGEWPAATFNHLGEAVAFDGRHVGFWGSWGNETSTLRLYCPGAGNRDRIAYCNQTLMCADGSIEKDPNSICDDTADPNWPTCYQEKQIPVQQGIFVHDIKKHSTRAVAKTGSRFDSFLFWNYSGKTPCGESEEDDGEAVRWRSSAFLAVSKPGGKSFAAAFKAVKGEVQGIYLVKGPRFTIRTLLDTTMEASLLDPEAPAGATITELGLEREGLRGHWLAISAKMGIEGSPEEDGMAGVYVTRTSGGGQR